MHKIIGSSGRDCVLVIGFQFNGSTTGLFESNLFWVDQYDPFLKIHIGRRTNPFILYLNAILKQPIQNNPSQKTADTILWMLMSLVFCSM